MTALHTFSQLEIAQQALSYLQYPNDIKSLEITAEPTTQTAIIKAILRSFPIAYGSIFSDQSYLINQASGRVRKLTTSDPIGDYFIYEYPDDCLFVNEITGGSPNDNLTYNDANSQIDGVLFYSGRAIIDGVSQVVIYSNVQFDYLYIKYNRYTDNLSQLPPDYADAIAYSLAIRIAGVVKPTLSQSFIPQLEASLNKIRDNLKDINNTANFVNQRSDLDNNDNKLFILRRSSGIPAANNPYALKWLNNG